MVFAVRVRVRDRCTVTSMDAQPDDPDPITAIERAVSELRRSGGRPRHQPGQHAPLGWKGGPHEHPFANMARYRLLSTLERLGDGASVNELAAAIGVDQPRASRVVADCVERGIVTKQTDPTDARRSVIALTDAGRAVLEERRRERRTTVERALQGFTADERAQFAGLLARFVAGGRSS